MSERMLERYEPKKLHHKIYLQENTGDGVLFSAVADMWIYSFPKWNSSQMHFHENCEVSQNIKFTEQCCVTASDFLWHFRCITCFISDKSVQSQHGNIIILLYQYQCLYYIIILILVLYWYYYISINIIRFIFPWS